MTSQESFRLTLIHSLITINLLLLLAQHVHCKDMCGRVPCVHGRCVQSVIAPPTTVSLQSMSAELLRKFIEGANVTSECMCDDLWFGTSCNMYPCSGRTRCTVFVYHLYITAVIFLQFFYYVCVEIRSYI